MGNKNAAWMFRAGALLVVLGFFLPVMTVSCGGLPGGAPLSLYDLTQAPLGQASLWLVPLAALVAFGAAVLPGMTAESDEWLRWGRWGGLGVSLAALGVVLLGLYSKTSQATSGLSELTGGVGAVQFAPQVGALMLLVGYVLMGIGQVNWGEPVSAWRPEPVMQGYGPVAVGEPPVRLAAGGGGGALAYLVSERGGATPIQGEVFTIGRSHTNSLQVNDPAVSRQHVRLCYAQGSWFVQDQHSQGGTYVNGQAVQAGRIHPNDQIRVGNTTFTFRLH